MSLETQQFEFGEFVLDAKEKVLLRHRKPLAITPKVFELLRVLVENQGHLVEKTYLMEKLWPDSFVEESNLTFSIRQLRKILGDEIRHPKFIETIPKRGYRFIADVSVDSQAKATQKLDDSPSNGNYSSPATVAEPGEEPRSKAAEGFLQAIGRRPVLYLTITLLGVFLLSGFIILKDRASILDIFRAPVGSSHDLRNLTLETLTDTGNTTSANISADGKLLAYVSLDAGKHSIWLRQLATGKSVPVIPPTEDFLLGISFSKDGEYLYYLHQPRNADIVLNKISIFGGNSKKLLSNFHGGYAISPDENRIAVVRMDKSGSTLVVADADGSNEKKVLAYAKPLSIVGISWSPDARWLAFCVTKFGGSGTGSRLVKVDLESGEEQPITEFAWNYLEGLIWLQDGTGFLACGRERPGEPDQIWFVSAANGSAEQITHDSSQLSLMGATADLGKIVLSRSYLDSTLSIADSHTPSDLQPVSTAQFDVAWTPNGELVFPSKDTLKTDIWIANPDGTNKRQLTANDEVERSPIVSPDGGLVVFVSSENSQQNIWRMDANGNDLRQLTYGEGAIRPAISQDGKQVFFNSVKDGSLWQVSIEGGEPQLLLNEQCFRAAVSPSGNKIAYFGTEGDKGMLFVKGFPEFKPLYRFEAFFNRASTPRVAWAGDETSLIYYQNDATDVGNLWSQPLGGGAARKLTNFTSQRIFDFSFSPDGARLAVTRGKWNHDAALLKGFR